MQETAYLTFLAEKYSCNPFSSSGKFAINISLSLSRFALK